MQQVYHDKLNTENIVLATHNLTRFEKIHTLSVAYINIIVERVTCMCIYYTKKCRRMYR